MPPAMVRSSGVHPELPAAFAGEHCETPAFIRHDEIVPPIAVQIRRRDSARMIVAHKDRLGSYLAELVPLRLQEYMDETLVSRGAEYVETAIPVHIRERHMEGPRS